MLANWLRAGLASGRVTTAYPGHKERLVQHHTWHTVAQASKTCCQSDCICTAICPTDAIDQTTAGGLEVDAGACIGCGRCIAQCKDGVFVWTQEIDLAVPTRAQLVPRNGGRSR